MSYLNPYLHPAHALDPRRRLRELSLDDNTLQAYLPYFTANHFRNEPDIGLIFDAWFRSHPDLRESSLHSPIGERAFRKAFHLVISCIGHAEECGEPPSGAGRRMIAMLEDFWEYVMTVESGRGASRAQSMFRALAEVLRAAAGGGLGSVLRTFFLGWLHEIAEEEDTLSLAGWCSGIVRSSMDPRHKQDCLRAIAALRPEVLAEIHGRGGDWMPLQSIDTPVRKWPRRRRADGRMWWDRENEGRIRRLIEGQDYLERTADRRRRKLDLRLEDVSYDRWPRRIDRARSSESLERALQRSRSPLVRLLEGEDRYVPRSGARYLDDPPYRDLLREPRLGDRYSERGRARYWEDLDLGDSRLPRVRIEEIV